MIGSKINEQGENTINISVCGSPISVLVLYNMLMVYYKVIILLSIQKL